MKRRFRGIWITVVIAFVWLNGCYGPKTSLFPPGEDDSIRTVYVVNQGWHTGIVVQRSNVDTTLWPGINDFSAYEFIEVGWGDADFYQSERNTFWLGFKALFLPTNTVLHVAGFNYPVQIYFKGYQIIKIRLSVDGFAQLCRFIGRSYKRTGEGHIIPLGVGLYGTNSRFYRANGTYWFNNTCNTWVAKALRAAGCPITPWYASTARNLFYQLSKFEEKYDS